ncbi:MAG: SlyX family protein [Phycisphaerales bacterium]|nr:SlyX family protein [Phycisphaerales bacterium]
MSDQSKNQDRIRKLEESAGYQDHTIEILSKEVTEINKLMLGLSRRMAVLESRLSELDDRVGEDPGNVPPPHSAGPDIPKDPL